jgi:hypothetical protein
MSVREAKRKAYGKGWDTWDAEVLLSSLANGFVFDDPAMPGPVSTIDSGHDRPLSRRETLRC